MPRRAPTPPSTSSPLDADGEQIADSVDYSIVRITYDYQWYQSDGRWRWQSTTREREVDAGTLALKADAPVNLSKRLQWGPHRLTVTDKRAKTSTTVTFYVGWYGGSSSAEDAPDTLKVASDRQKYAPGDTAKLRIEAPFAGEAVVAIATDRVLATYSTQVAAGGTTIDIPMKGEWGAGAYALVTAWRPLARLPSARRCAPSARSGSASIPRCARSPCRSPRPRR